MGANRRFRPISALSSKRDPVRDRDGTWATIAEVLVSTDNYVIIAPNPGLEPCDLEGASGLSSWLRRRARLETFVGEWLEVVGERCEPQREARGGG
jgi:hypothetical protein